MSAWMSPADQGRERGTLPLVKGEELSCRFPSPWETLEVHTVQCSICRILHLMTFSRSSFPIPVAWLSSSGVAPLLGWPCMEEVAGIIYVMVSLEENKCLQISQPDHSLLQHRQGVLTSLCSLEEPCCSPVALLLAQHSTGPSTTWTGRAPAVCFKLLHFAY